MTTTTMKAAENKVVLTPNEVTLDINKVKDLVKKTFILPPRHDLVVNLIRGHSFRVHIFKTHQKPDFVYETRERVHTEFVVVEECGKEMKLIREKEKFDWEI